MRSLQSPLYRQLRGGWRGVKEMDREKWEAGGMGWGGGANSLSFVVFFFILVEQ